MLAEDVPAALITDLHMPCLSGIELIKSVRQHTLLLELPILVLTTETECDFKRRAREAGATAWLQKPFEDEHLCAAIRTILQSAYTVDIVWRSGDIGVLSGN
ncbi:response regulator receiver protein [Bradyrhizobium lupini HPC(L)]|uniref:Response regulator receiver protein n=1 Tax=Bradyrhizobium lupini HPC(L) TaxID=1229491 RepID=A0ABN0HJI7_RHILU|nr:response regulator receiver protein [Bradyrhizobium lupini HPC(L)]